MDDVTAAVYKHGEILRYCLVLDMLMSSMLSMIKSELASRVIPVRQCSDPIDGNFLGNGMNHEMEIEI